jgi:virginiamycin B lyase
LWVALLGRSVPPSTAEAQPFITEFTLPTSNVDLQLITAGPDGDVWFAAGAGSLGRITPAGVITEFPSARPVRGPPG